MLIAEDDESLRRLLERFLQAKGHETVTAADGTSALEKLRQQKFDVALVDIIMPGLDGLEVLRQMRDEPEPPEVVIMTGDGTVDTAITAVKLGAYDYVAKPYRTEEIEVVVQKAAEKRDLATENARLQSALAEVSGGGRIVSQDPMVLEFIDSIPEFAATGRPVLITGERGTGKDTFVRAIHMAAGEGECVGVDADGPTSYDVDSALFGHERGARPGTDHARAGALERANPGTVVLRNVHALAPELQTKLLGAIRNHEFLRAGGTRPIAWRGRIVATTPRDLAAAVSRGDFYGELYAELAGQAIHLPPLRERLGDLLLLANHFLDKLAGARAPTFEAAAIEALKQYSWPGNVSELKNIVERAAMLATGPVIRKADIPLPGIISTNTPASGLPLAELERQHILAVLTEENWHQGNAATKLGISSKTLYRKIREYGFMRPRDSSGG